MARARVTCDSFAVGDDDDETRVERDGLDEAARQDDDGGEAHVVVPWGELSPDALRGVIVEFVTREGTEYGARDVELDVKIADVRRQLERGEVAVLFDAKSSSVNLVTARELRRLGVG